MFTQKTPKKLQNPSKNPKPPKSLKNPTKTPKKIPKPPKKKPRNYSNIAK